MHITTLILVPKLPLPPEIQDGTLVTIREAQEKNKAYLLIDLSVSANINVQTILDWMSENNVRILNIDGPRESTCPGIYTSCLTFLEIFFPKLNNAHTPSIRRCT